MAIDTDHHRFSSEPAIVLPNPQKIFRYMFIAMDQPKHDVQRQWRLLLSPSLSDVADYPRATQYVLDSVPINQN